MAKVTFLQPTKLSDLDFDSRPTGRSTATYADVHSENPVAAVSLIGDGFLITANPISWKGDIRAAMIDSPDPVIRVAPPTTTMAKMSAATT